jgi:hypothetical protein
VVLKMGALTRRLLPYFIAEEYTIDLKESVKALSITDERRV